MREDQGKQVHAGSIIIDGLNVSRWDGETFRQVQGGGLTAINATIAVQEGFRETIEHLADWGELFEQYRDLIMPARSVDDIHAAKRAGKVGVIFGFQSTDPIEKDLRLLTIFQELGVRIIQITYNERNYAGDGCQEKTDCGLSRFGEELIGEMNRLGLLVDLSHVGYRTSMEAIEASTQPVTFTHANPRALFDNVRNKTDEQLLAVARKGGVIGASIYPVLLAAGSRATLDDFVDVVDYLVKLVGIEHIGVGTDFTEGQSVEWITRLRTGKSLRGPVITSQWPLQYPEGIRSAAEFPNITRTLLARGYSVEHTRMIMGENFLRLFGTVWG
jgi:membrane dipeptidase